MNGFNCLNSVAFHLCHSVLWGFWQILLLRFSLCCLKQLCVLQTSLSRLVLASILGSTIPSEGVYWFDEGLGRFGITDDSTKLNWHVSFLVTQTLSLQFHDFLNCGLSTCFDKYISESQMFRFSDHSMLLNFWTARDYQDLNCDTCVLSFVSTKFFFTPFLTFFFWSIKQCSRSWWKAFWPISATISENCLQHYLQSHFPDWDLN